MGFSARQTNVLKIIHPGRYEQIYRQPIIAGEIMRKYPRHCIARPNVFQFPWIVVRPESLLVPGKVFYLVPYKTLDKLLKAKKPELQSVLDSTQDKSSKLYQFLLNSIKPKSPTKSLAGRTPKHRRELDETEEYYYVETKEQEGLYKSDSYESWDRMQRNLQQLQESFDINSGFDSPDDMSRNVRPRVTSPECLELMRDRSCLRKPDSYRREMNLKVSFTSPIVIRSNRIGSPCDQHDDMVLQLTSLRM